MYPAIGEHSNHYTNGPVYIYIKNHKPSKKMRRMKFFVILRYKWIN